MTPFSANGIGGIAKGSYLGENLVRSVYNICRTWPRGKLPKNYFEPVRSKAPVLIFSGALDPSNPAAEGDRVSAFLPSSLHLKMNGVSHDFPSCGLTVIAAFVGLGTTHGLDTSCIAKLQRAPFIVEKTLLNNR